MKINLNGRTETLSGELSISALLAKHNLTSATLAVELNGQIINREDLASTTLKEADSLELIRFMGGG